MGIMTKSIKSFSLLPLWWSHGSESVAPPIIHLARCSNAHTILMSFIRMFHPPPQRIDLCRTRAVRVQIMGLTTKSSNIAGSVIDWQSLYGCGCHDYGVGVSVGGMLGENASNPFDVRNRLLPWLAIHVMRIY